MVGTVCINKTVFMCITMIIMIIALGLLVYINLRPPTYTPTIPPNTPITPITPVTTPITPIASTASVQRVITAPVIHNSVDPVREYDYNKLADPLEQPMRRVARHEVPPAYFKRMIDQPTMGYPDNYTQIGVLVKTGHHGRDTRDNNDRNGDRNGDNKILRLFGRQVYPGSYTYEYYTMVNSGLDRIKIPVYNKGKKELYDGDTVRIRELDDEYRVDLYKYEEPKYYPDIIY